MIEAVQKLKLQGNSWMITMPRRLCIEMGLMPGHFLKLDYDDVTGLCTIRRWGVDNVSVSPGILASPMPDPKR